MKYAIILAAAAVLTVQSGVATAKVSKEEADRLGKDLSLIHI